VKDGDLRISAGVRRHPPVRFRFDGVDYAAPEGETLAAALLAAGVTTLRRAPVDGGPRGLFCAMGVCQECLVLVEGRRVEACRIRVRDGLSAASLA
jgi:predicted molibdopterin-dependent oxidoreductase YjgC